MLTNLVNITIAESYQDAPNYGEETTAVKIDKCIIVKKGMESGLPSIDLQMTDQYGNQYVAMVTANIIDMLAQTVRGAARE